MLELRNKRDTYLNTCRNILKTAQDAGRALTAAEQHDYDNLLGKIEQLNQTLKRAGQLSDLRLELEKPIQPANGSITHREALYIGQTADGVRVRGYRPGEPMATATAADAPGIGAYLRGIVTGHWATPELRALSEGSSTAGGFLVPDPLSTRIIDLARAQTVCIRAGAVTVPLPNGSLTFATQTADPTAAWRGENVAISESEPTFGAIILSAKSLACYCKLSQELVADGNNVDGIVSRALSAALALELDRACLFGTGLTYQPKGLTAFVGAESGNINVLTTVGSLSNYDDFLDAIYDIELANGPSAENLALIAHPRTYTTLAKLKTGISNDNTPLVPPESYRLLKKFATTAVPINEGAGTASEAIVGDFSQMLIGVAQEITLQVSDVASDSTSSAFVNHQLFLKATLRADVMLQRPAFFSQLPGISA